MQLCEYTAQEAGAAARPGLALDWVCPPPLHVMTPVSLGQPCRAPGVRVWFSWGGGRSTKDGWSEALTDVGELWRHKARGRRGCGPNGWAGCPLPVHAGAPSARRAQRGRAEPMSQATAVGAAGAGKQPWQRTRVSPRPEGRVGHRVPPTPSNVGPNSEEWAGRPGGCKPCRGRGADLLCKIIMVVKCQQLCWGAQIWSQGRSGDRELSQANWAWLGAGKLQGSHRPCPAPGQDTSQGTLLRPR